MLGGSGGGIGDGGGGGGGGGRGIGSMVELNVCLNWPVAWIYLRRGSNGDGWFRRKESSDAHLGNALWSMNHSSSYHVHTNRKWLTVSSAFLVQLVHLGEAAHLIWCRCLLRPTWPVWSCIRIEACLRVNDLVRFIHFLDGVDLSILLVSFWCGESFQCLFQTCCILDLFSWHNAAMLVGIVFLRNVGKSFVGLELPLAALFANTSTCSLGRKPWWDI